MNEIESINYLINIIKLNNKFAFLRYDETF